MRFSDDKKAAYRAAAQMLSTFVAAIMKMTVSKFIETVKKINSGEVEAPNLALKLRAIRASREARDIMELRMARNELPLELHEVLFPRPKDGTRDNGLGRGFVGVLLEVFLRTGGAKDGIATGLSPVLPMRLSLSIYETLLELRKKHPAIWKEMGFEPETISCRASGSSIDELLAESESGKETTAAALWRIAQASHSAWVAKRSLLRESRGSNHVTTKSEAADDLFVGIVEAGEETVAVAPSLSAGADIVADISHENISDEVVELQFQEDAFEDDDEEEGASFLEEAPSSAVTDDLDAELAFAAATSSDEPSGLTTIEELATAIEASDGGIQAVRAVLVKKLRAQEISFRDGLARARQYKILS